MFCFHELLLFFDIIYNSSVINTQLIVEEGTRNDKDKAKTFAGKKNNNKAKNITITKSSSLFLKKQYDKYVILFN